MMQEVTNDANGESTYDFVADAKQSELPDSASLTHSFSSSSSGLSGLSTPTPAMQPPLPASSFMTGNQTTASVPKPSYEYPPGMAPPSLSGARLPGEAPKASSSSHMFPPAFRPPVSTAVSSSASPFASSSNPSFPGAPSAHRSSGGPDLNEIFGADVMANLPPLNSGNTSSIASKFPPPVAQSSASYSAFSPSTSTFSSSTPSGLPALSSPMSPALSSPMPAPPLAMPKMSSTSGVNPFSSQAAGSHLPSFSGFVPPHPPVASSSNILTPAAYAPLPTTSTPAPVAMFSLPAAPQSLPPLGAPPSFPVQQFQDPSTSYSAPYDQNSVYSPSGMSVSMGPSGMQQSYGIGQSHGSHGANRSWWAQTSIDTLKNVTEKAKSTVYSLMTTLDPQMKTHTGPGNEAGPASGDLTMFYIGNELSMIEILRSGLDQLYKNLHIYTRSGAAPGHKLQVGFSNALNTANMTLQLAQAAPPIQNSLLLAVEPFVVELSPNNWYASSCLVLCDAPRGANLHIFSQLTPLPEGLLTQSGEQVLSAPLEELVMRHIPMAGRENWIEQMTGVSWGATVALAARQLFGIYRKRFGC